MKVINQKDYIVEENFVIIRQGGKGRKYTMCTWTVQCPIGQLDGCKGCPAYFVSGDIVTREEAVEWWEEQ